MTDLPTDARLPWTTPVLETLGTMADVESDAGGDIDGDGLNQSGVTAS